MLIWLDKREAILIAFLVGAALAVAMVIALVLAVDELPEMHMAKVTLQ